MFYIQPTPEDITSALDSWTWLPLESKHPILVTAFGDIFFSADSGMWFLDTLEGRLTRVCATRDELDQILMTEDGENHYLFAGFVERAQREGMILEQGQCYDFKLNPVVGGSIEYENVERQNFVVAVNIAGQLHEKVKDLPPETRISEFSIEDDTK